MRVLYCRPTDGAWNVITIAAQLAARLLEADYLEVPATRERGRVARTTGYLPRVRGSDDLLLIAPQPVDLQAILRRDHWIRGHRQVAAWVVDSWWDDRIPHVARQGRHFDRIYVSERENLDVWADRTGAQVHWLPTGSNALGWGSARQPRRTVLQRLGRQPDAWEDDARTSAAADRLGLTFAGRPAFVHDGPEAAMRTLMEHLSHARAVLAFSNSVSPSRYTHPRMQYLTGRWADALASGATVAGVPPQCASADELLWPEATIAVSPTDLEAGLATIRDWNDTYDPGVARLNHLRALQRFDWRWRIKQIADDLGRSTPTLEAELGRLRSRIEETSGLA